MTAAAHRARWPWAALAVFFALAIVGMTGVVVNDESVAEQAVFAVAFSMFGVVGALVLSREPGNRIGGLLLYGSCAVATAFAGGELVTYLADRGTTEGPGVVALGLLSEVGWIVGILPVLLLLPLLFPDGRLPSPGWRPLAWGVWASLAFLAVAVTLGSEVLTGSTGDIEIANPLFVPAIGDLAISDAVINVLLLGLIVGSVASIVVRFRRSRGVERQQIKWVALAVLFMAASFLLSMVLTLFGLDEEALVNSLITGAAFLFLPISVGVAVLQYRLYDLDVVVKKALVAGTLALVGILVYGAVVGVFGVVVAEGESSGSVFVIALLLGLAFRPVTRLARRLADRLVYGRRATPYEVLTEFSGRLGEAYATEDVLGRMAQLLGAGTGAEAAHVWLRLGDALRPVATWPADAPAPRSESAKGDALPLLTGQTTVEVRDGGELLGALSVAMPANDPMDPAKERVVRDLAGQAGLVLRNVRLVEELRAAQRRLVAARDEERRRLERNIHDGAQQQLVALAVQARLARSVVGRDPDKGDQMLERIEADLQAALEDLRDLARGIYPPLLADKGLGAALEAQARRSPVPVTVEADGLGRLPQEVEAAVYFSCLEALQNVAKYAEADAARVTLTRRNGHLLFEVGDDGRGFDPDATGYGTGLQGIADRLATLDGSFEVRSTPGEWTVVRGRIPLGEAQR